MIEHVTLANAAELDAYVAALPNGHFMQTSLWGKVKTDWPWHGLILRGEDGKIRGTMALLSHRMHLIRTSFLYAPRGPQCAYGDKEAFRALIEGAKAYGKQVGACFLRIDPEVPETDEDFAAFARSLGFSIDAATDFSLYQPRLVYVSDLTGLTEDTLETIYHRTCRTKIHRAQKGRLTVRTGTEADLPAFETMMEATAAKNHFTARPQAYFRDLLRGLGDAGRLYIAELDGQPQAGSISCYYGTSGSFLYGCSKPTEQNLNATELLQWHMQAEAIRRGCTRFDFRGVEGLPNEDNPLYGLHRYKQGFGAKYVAWVGQLDLILKPLAAKLTFRIMNRRATGQAVPPTKEDKPNP